MAVPKVPLSVDDIVARQKAEKEAASKPKFLTKAERAAIALERRNAELAESQERQAIEREEREKLERAAEEERKKQDAARYSSGGAGGGRYGQQGGYGMNNGNRGLPYGGPGGAYGQNGQNGGYGQNGQNGGYGQNGQNGQNGAYDRNAQGQAGRGGRGGPPPGGPRNGSYQPSPLAQAPSAQPPSGPRSMGPPSGPSSSRTTDGPSDSAAPPTDAELLAIRKRYLGAASAAGSNGPVKAPKKVRKLVEKKFMFDWDASEDTYIEAGGGWRDDVSGKMNGVEIQSGVGIGTMLGGRLAGYDEGGRRKGAGLAANDHLADSLERRRAGRSGIDERHWTEKPLSEMRDRDWRIFREDFAIAARGGSIPVPLRSWAESAIPPEILKVIDEIGYKEPSPIQRQAIPIGLQNRDLIGIAQTGSGKTAAFVIPMLEYISHLPLFTEENKHLGPYALIMAPTRELAQQIESETKRFAVPLGYNTVSIVGGRAVEEQQYNLREGAQIIIATPGRLKDIIDRNILVLSQCRYVVMDEADRMVDLGFEQDLNFILDAMPADYAKPEGLVIDPAAPEKGWEGFRVTTLFSATMPPIVERLAKQYLRRPATVVIGNAGEAVDTVEQRVEFVAGEEKKKTRLIEILRSMGLAPPLIVFVNEKKTADMVVKYVRQAGRSATTLHSDKNQEQREAALQSLRDGESEVLVATDLAGRGIDVPDVTAVINWQMASTIEKYVHRIGRTGRAGKTGIAITFLSSPADDETMYDLKQEISKSPISAMNSELAHHPSARQRITREMKRKREDDE